MGHNDKSQEPKKLYNYKEYQCIISFFCKIVNVKEYAQKSTVFNRFYIISHSDEY